MTLIGRELKRADGEALSFEFDQSVGVRKGDAKLLAEIDAALVKARPKIEAILTAEGIPLLQPKT
jgi:mxaJ protein